MSFILKMHNMSSLEASVEHGIPSSRYLSVGQFAARYGQSASNINALTSYLAGFDIKTTVYADDLDVVATGTAGDFDKALTITEENVYVPAAGGQRAVRRRPQAHVLHQHAGAAAAVPAGQLRDGHPRPVELRPVRQRHRQAGQPDQAAGGQQ